MNHLIRGGPADRCGQIRPGDIIASIDSRDVRGKGVAEIRNFIVGAEGRCACVYVCVCVCVCVHACVPLVGPSPLNMFFFLRACVYVCASDCFHTGVVG